MGYTVIMSNAVELPVKPVCDIPGGTWFVGKLERSEDTRLFYRALGIQNSIQVFNEYNRVTWFGANYKDSIYDYQEVNVEIRVTSYHDVIVNGKNPPPTLA